VRRVQLATLLSLENAALYLVLRPQNTLHQDSAARRDRSVAAVQFTCESFTLLFGEHKFMANESTKLHSRVNSIHFMSVNITSQC
jgi:hypothetical protein